MEMEKRKKRKPLRDVDPYATISRSRAPWQTEVMQGFAPCGDVVFGPTELHPEGVLHVGGALFFNCAQSLRRYERELRNDFHKGIGTTVIQYER